MWAAINSVTTVVSLAAFVVAAGCYVAIRYFAERRRSQRELIEATPWKDRAPLVAAALKAFHVDTSRLTKDQQYQLAMHQIDNRHIRLMTGQRAALIVALALAVLAGFVLYFHLPGRRLDEIKEAIDRLGSSYKTEQLLVRYPLGYAIFEIDHQNRVFPYDHRLLDQYEINWDTAKVIQNTDTSVALQLPELSTKDGRCAIKDVIVGGDKRIGRFGGAGICGLQMSSEVLAITSDGIVFLVGFQQRPKMTDEHGPA